MSDDVLTRDNDGNLAVRTVSSTGDNYVNKDDVYTRDSEGKLCVRTTGEGGGGSIDESRVIVKSATIPAASVDNLGKFYCYSGATNATYTHGYIYQCIAGSVSYEANIAFEHSTFASEDFYKAGQLIVDAGVADPTLVTGGTMTYALAGNLWSIVFTDANGNALNTAYNIYTDDLEQDYDILPTVDPSEFVDGQVVNMSINNVIAHQDYLWERMDVQPSTEIGRYLSGWNCATGLAATNPPTSPYQYKTGDYFIVSSVATGGANNYKPNGSSYTTGVASTTVESSAVAINDTYLYDGTNWTLLKTGSAVTSVNGQVGDVTVQATLVSGTNIKTINGSSVLGSGDLELSTYLTYPSGWTTNSTTKAFCDDVSADTSAVKGKAYLGEVTINDLPASLGNGEVVVEIMDGTTAQNKVIVLTLTSGNTAPYMWKYTYWNGGANVSGWQTWATAAQGAKADTAVQPADLATVATTGAYSDLIGTPTIPEPIQVSTLPTASATELGNIYQFTGTTDANYTNGYFYKCVSDGAVTPTYSWSRVDVQPQSGGLPSQTGHAGEFLTTDGTDASWATINALQNTATGTNSLTLLGTATNYMYCVNIGVASSATYTNNTAVGYHAQATGDGATAYGRYTTASGTHSLAVGNMTEASGTNSIAIGLESVASGTRSIQIGTKGYTNSNANTFKVGNNNGNFEIMSADGTIPTDRFTTTPVADGTYVPTLTISSGTATRSWAAPGGGGAIPATATLAVADWSNNSQTVNVTGVTASNNVIVAAAPASQSDYTTAGILCTAQGAGTLTFTCTTTPSSAITVNVLII